MPEVRLISGGAKNNLLHALSGTPTVLIRITQCEGSCMCWVLIVAHADRAQKGLI